MDGIEVTSYVNFMGFTWSLNVRLPTSEHLTFGVLYNTLCIKSGSTSLSAPCTPTTQRSKVDARSPQSGLWHAPGDDRSH